MHEPRGRILSVASPVADLEASGPRWRLVVYVKTGSSRLARDFDFQCRNLGLTAREVQDWGYLTAYEVVGDAQALRRLSERACIRDCHHCLDVRPPQRGAGTGPAVRRRKRRTARKRLPVADNSLNDHVAQVWALMQHSQETPVLPPNSR